jgi:hypothetical protein
VQSNLLPVADAIAARLVEVLAPTFPAAEVFVTWFDERFDPKTTTGFKVYVTPRGDVPGPIAEGGNRRAQPLLYHFVLTFAERIPSTVQGADGKDAWTRERVEAVGQCRAALDDPRQFTLPGLESVGLEPIESDEREAADVEYLRRLGMFLSSFALTIREDA